MKKDEEGKIGGKAARAVLMKTQLPNTTLVKIWDLSDIDKDGKLDREEFAVVGWRLVCRAHTVIIYIWHV